MRRAGRVALVVLLDLRATWHCWRTKRHAVKAQKHTEAMHRHALATFRDNDRIRVLMREGAR